MLIVWVTSKAANGGFESENQSFNAFQILQTLNVIYLFCQITKTVGKYFVF